MFETCSAVSAKISPCVPVGLRTPTRYRLSPVTTDDELPGAALGAALKAAREGRSLSIRQAADRAKISEGRWRQLERGYALHGEGIKVPVRPKGTTLRSVATAVGLDVAKAFDLAGLPPPDLEDEIQPVGLGLDAEADGLPSEDVEAIRAQVRALKRARGIDT